MPKKILIVDDEKEMVRCLVDLLSCRGYELITALDGLHATRQINMAKPDLVILDIMMPAGGGIQVLEKVRQNVKAFSLPVIVITAKTDEDTRKTVEKLGVSAYLIKPLNMPQLLQSVTDILGK
jgi:DNA-binding response OmpR family regulator